MHHRRSDSEEFRYRLNRKACRGLQDPRNADTGIVKWGLCELHPSLFSWYDHFSLDREMKSFSRGIVTSCTLFQLMYAISVTEKM
jgi:hypothetical protein